MSGRVHMGEWLAQASLPRQTLPHTLCYLQYIYEEKSYDAGRPGNKAAVLVSAFFFFEKENHKMYYP